MRHKRRLTQRQRKFLSALRDEPATLEPTVKRLGIRAWVLGQWLRHPVFRDALAGVMREVRVAGQLELRLAARKARRDLARMVNGDLTGNHVHRQACYDTIELEQHESRPRKSGGGTSSAKRREIPPAAGIPRPHPGHSPERAEQLIEELKALQADQTPDEPEEAALPGIDPA